MSANKPVIITAIAIVVAGALASGWIFATNQWKDDGPSALGLNEIAKNGTVQGELYPGDPVREAGVVQAEDERLVYVRTISSAARWRVDGLEGPYRIQTGATYTLVLPARAAPYTGADLLALAPDTFVAQPDGSYLLSESVAVLAGATLSLGTLDGLNLRLKSDSESFVSIVALGGSLTVAGTKGAPVSVTSWDAATRSSDNDTTDGRAYIRVIGGHASLSYVNIADLGFWSGNTGGLALTGTETLSTFRSGADASRAAEAESTEAAAVAGARLLPNVELDTLSSETDEDYSLVTAGLSHVTVSGNAFGLFITNAEDIAVTDTTITGSLVDGLVLHRSVSASKISRTTSTKNAVDGFTIGRSSTGIVLSGITAKDNGRNGVSVDGQPLADGPNAVGTSVRTYGDNQVNDSTITANGRYGIELSGGRDLTVAGNTITKNAVGVVVNHAATQVSILDNIFRGQARQSVAIRDAGAEATVTGNTITGGDTGVYVRAADVAVTGNTLSAISNHGITLLGDVGATRVTDNSVAGYGSRAVWDDASTGGVINKNDLLDWRPATTVESVVNSVFQPLTFVWLLLGLLLVVTAVTRRRELRVRSIRNPYSERVPLTALSKGIVSPDLNGRLS